MKYSTFANWTAKRKRTQTANTPRATGGDNATRVRWLEAVIDQAQDGAGQESGVLTLDFGGGARAIAGNWQAELNGPNPVASRRQRQNGCD